MDHDFWLERWRQNETRFHRADFHPFLVEYFKGLKPGRVLVPLCGKTLDMVWLQRQGHTVVGVELSELACGAFFFDNGIPFTTQTEGPFRIFRGERIELWCGDFFKYKAGGFEYFYDRAALVALPMAMRKDYAAHLNKLSLEQGLLITFEYPQNQAEGPPFAVLQDEVQTLFGARFAVDLRLRNKNPDLSRNPRFQHLTETAECAYTLTSKAARR